MPVCGFSDEAIRTGVPLLVSNELERDLGRANIFVYITECEGLGSGVLLAMSAGLAVVASDVGGVREIVEDGCNGLRTANAAAAIGGCIRRFVDDPELVKTAGGNARRTVEQRFTVERMVSETMRVYRQVLA